jgi:cytochrome c biogenesis protein ResB
VRRLLDLLASLRLTLALLVALAAFFLVGLAVPQKAILQRELYAEWQRQLPTVVATLEALGLTDIHGSPLAIALWTAFFVNLAAVMASRLPGTVRRVRIDGPVPDPAGFPLRRTIPGGGAGLDAVHDFFRARRFAVHREGERLRAVRNRRAPLATLAFHLSFFLVAAGGVTSALTRFDGHVDLGQGETFTGALEQYDGSPRLGRFAEPPRSRFIVEGVRSEVQGGTVTDVQVHVRDERGFLRTIAVNRPYEAGGAAFVFKNLGVAPLLVVTDSDGRQRFAGFMRLNVLMGRTDAFSLLGQQFTAELFPDHVVGAEGEGTRSQEMRDPVLRLTVEARSGRKVAASLRPGEEMALGPYRLAFVDWRYWVRLYVRSERGLWAVWLGFALGLAALVCRLFLYRREYVAGASADGGWVVVAGRAEYYRALFEDELARVASDLEVHLRAAAPGERPGGRTAPPA